MCQHSHALPPPALSPPAQPRPRTPRIPLVLAVMGLVLAMMIYGPIRGIRLRLFRR